MPGERIWFNNADRAVAAARVVLSGFAMVAVEVDPPTVASNWATTVIAVYFGLAVLFAAILWRRPRTARPLGGWAIGVDGLMLTALLYTATGGASPFFPMLLFVILAATLRWRERGALWAGAATLVLFLPSALLLPGFGPSAGDETMRFVVRAGHLVAMTGLLIYFGAQRERLWLATVDAERARLSRDLHDGILQFLSGLSLQLRVVENEAARDPEAARDRFARLRESLVAEQRELREFVTDFARPQGAQPTPGDLAGLGRLLSNHWDVDVEVDSGEDFDAGPLAGDVRQIVRESVANAVRHGGASEIAIRARREPGAITLDIRDNGSGFDETGTFDTARMRAEGIGPKSLRERVAQLGGALVAESRDTGLMLSIKLPLDSPDAA